MTLREEQSAFLHDVVKLFQFCWAAGFELTGGELARTIEQQQLYVQMGRSKTLKSSHIQRLAIDLNFFKEDKLVQSREDLHEVGNYWEGLSSKNRWGGNWRGLVDSHKSTFVDCPHFERQVGQQ